jgi:hypothetical protein
MNLRKILIVIIATVFTGLAGYGQMTSGSLSGTIKDKGAGVQGAVVEAVNPETNAKYRSTTAKNGFYNINNMVPGLYNVTITYGEEKHTLEGVLVKLNEGTDADHEFNPKTETNIIITGSGRKVQTKTGSSSTFGPRVINTTPNINRSLTTTTQLTPQAGGGNSFGGQDGRRNNVTIDGTNFNNNFGLRSDPLPGGSSQPISLDAIDEINVAISPFDVRQANFTGAGLSATTRKGSNTRSGSIYGFIRNNGLIGRSAVGQKTPIPVKSSAKIYGARFGGAIVKNKLFYFVSAEAEERSAPGIVWKATRTGVAPDANTSRAHADSLTKLSNHLRTKFGYETGKFEGIDNFLVNNWKVLARLDWQATEKHLISLRYNQYKNIDDQLLNGTSNPGAALPNNRWSQNALSFQNSNYGFENKLQSLAFEVKSNFSNKVSNQFIATYTKANDGRTSDSRPFPFIEIMNHNPTTAFAVSTDNIMSAGYELFTWKNNVENNTLNIVNNFTYNTGKHNLTGGLQYENIYVNNSFFRFGTSYYRFNSLDAFINDSTPTMFSYTFPSVPGKEAVELDFGQISFYAQDEIRVNSKLKLNLGVRFDRPLFQNNLTGNAAVDAFTFKDLDGKNLNFQSAKWPKERIYASPRIGFNWDMEGNKEKTLRGGAGVFTGRFPFVWFTNQPSNSYTTVRQFTATPNRDRSYLFNPQIDAYDAQIRALPNTTAITNLVYVDENFRMPQVFRFSLGYDQKLDKDWTVSLDGIINKDINNLLYYNANQAQPVGFSGGADNRPIYGSSSATRRINAGISDAMVFTNTKKGFGMIGTVQLAKRFSNNWDFSVAYTHTIGMDISGNPGATANSAWNVIPSVNGNNTLDLAPNDFTTTHRIVAYGSYKINWSKMFPTTISLVYTGFNQGRFSYTYSSDRNSDGIATNDLMYIPNNPSEITFVTNGSFTPQQQSDAFFAYIEQDKYLRKNKGRVAERNAAQFPFLSNLDMRILQDILPYSKNRKYGIQLSFEVENFTNMINSNWGVSKRTNVANARLLSVAGGATVNSNPTYRLNLVNGQLPTRTFVSNVTVANTWRANFGVRLNF